MASTLTNRERAHLKAKAHVLEPFVHVGGAGLTDAVVAEVEKALTARELIKVRIAGDDRGQRVAVGDAICARTGAAAVQRVGKVLILWRPRPLDEAAPATSSATSSTPSKASGPTAAPAKSAKRPAPARPATSAKASRPARRPTPATRAKRRS